MKLLHMRTLQESALIQPTSKPCILRTNAMCRGLPASQAACVAICLRRNLPAIHLRFKTWVSDRRRVVLDNDGQFAYQQRLFALVEGQNPGFQFNVDPGSGGRNTDVFVKGTKPREAQNGRVISNHERNYVECQWPHQSCLSMAHWFSKSRYNGPVAMHVHDLLAVLFSSC